MNKLNLGCGEDYKEGWINVDFNKKVKADVYINLNEKLLWDDDSIDGILLDNVLEHIEKRYLFKFIDELWRICKQNAIIKIYTPHFSGMYALKHPTHYSFYGIHSFEIMNYKSAFTGERYNKARFKIRKEELMFFHHNLLNFKFLNKIPINWIFNFSKNWQLLMERFQFLGFDEIYYELEVKKWK